MREESASWEPSEGELHPLFVNSRREAVLIFATWVVALFWAVPYCYLNGFRQPTDPAELELILGIPAWVVWGIIAPWLIADVVTTIFCFAYMKDDDLGDVSGEGDHKSAVAEEGAE